MNSRAAAPKYSRCMMMRTMPLAIYRKLRMRFSGFERAQFAVRHGRTPCRFWKRHVANARVPRVALMPDSNHS